MSSVSPAGSVLERVRNHLLRQEPSQARAEVEKLLTEEPGDAEALHLLGMAEVALDRLPEGIAFLRRAYGLAMNQATFRANLATALYLQGCRLLAVNHLNEARLALEECLAHDPSRGRAHAALVDVFTLAGRHHDALAYCEALFGLTKNAAHLFALAWSRFLAGDVDGAIRDARGAFAAGHRSPESASGHLFILLHDADQTGESLRDEHVKQSNRNSALSVPAPRSARRRAGPLRIGYISSDLYGSPFRHFFLPVLRQHDRAAVHVTCYSTNPKRDRHTAVFEQLSDAWRDTARWTTEELRARICGDEIDVLVDCCSHFQHNQLALFPMRPAPVQAVYPNYPGTTGAPGLDYLFTDRWVCPTGSEKQFSEECWKLSGGYLAYEAPEPLPLRESANMEIVFGLFQRPSKMNRTLWDAVAWILSRVGGSRLLIHHSSAELDEPGSAARRQALAELERRGIEGERVDFHGARPLREHLALLGTADIALDSFPYNGQTTTCECLWMGVPVITLIGATHVSRVGFEILDRAGLPELAASSMAEYVERAVALALNADALRALRRSLRERLAASPVMDGGALTRGLEDAYTQLYERHSN